MNNTFPRRLVEEIPACSDIASSENRICTKGIERINALLLTSPTMEFSEDERSKQTERRKENSVRNNPNVLIYTCKAMCLGTYLSIVKFSRWYPRMKKLM